MDSVTLQHHPCAELGKQSVSADNPCGIAVKYEPDFEALETELAKAESLANETVDWSKVASLAESILKSQSKDLLVAAYYAHALFLNEGYKGLATGLQIISDLVDTHWENMFPPAKRMRARASAVQWLAEKTGDLVTAKNPTPEDAMYVVASHNLLASILDKLDEKMSSDAPGMLELSRPLKDQKRIADEHYKPEPAAAPTAGNEPSSGREPSSGSEPSVGNEPSAGDQPSAEAPAPAAQQAAPATAEQSVAQQPQAQPAAAVPEDKKESDQPAAPEEKGPAFGIEHPLSEIGLTPCAGDAPAGIAIKYEPSGEELDTEMAKLESLTGETINWDTVKRLASGIIEKESKDIQVATHLTKALMETEGYVGLAVGVKILHDMVDKYWEDMFPPMKRMRARETALNHLSEKAGEFLEAKKPTPQDAKAVLACHEMTSALMEKLDEKIEGGGPGFLEMTRPLKTYKSAAEEQVKPATAPTPAAAPQGQPGAAPQPGAVPGAQPPAGAVPQTSPQGQAAPAAAASGNDPVKAAEEAPVEHELAGIGVVACAGDAPAGIAIKYEPSGEKLDEEMAKLESLTGDTIDWNTVKRLSGDILEKESKDLQVATHLTKALMELEGYKGLAVGLKIIRDMCNEYWEGMFPPVKRMRARETSLNHLSEKAGEFIESKKPANAADAKAVIQCQKQLADLMDVLDKKIEGGGPGFLELTRPLKAVRGAAEELLKPKTAAAPPPPAAAQPAAATAGQPAAAPPPPRPKAASGSSGGGGGLSLDQIGSENEAKRGMRAVQDAQRKVGEYLVSAKITDPRPYRLNRIACWLMIEGAPVAQGGKTQLPAPPAEKLKKIKEMFEAEQWEDCIKEAEPFLSKSPFWLDGHRFVAQALDNIGKEGEKARLTVCREVRAFLERAPGAQDMVYQDGTEFADADTKMWINEEVMVSAGGDGGESASAEIEEAMAEAKALLVKKKEDEAFLLIDQGIRSARGRRDAVEWRLSLADLLKQTGKIEVAVPLLRALANEVQQAGFVDWDPKLCAKIYRQQFELTTALAQKNNNDAVLLEQASEAYSHFCLADPIQAMKTQVKPAPAKPAAVNQAPANQAPPPPPKSAKANKTKEQQA